LEFDYKWFLKDGYPSVGDSSVFGTFVCGGGSTMGYKLAGFNHLGGVEIDVELADIYKLNHNPLYLYKEDIRVFNERQELPDELYELDILDGSPPCSSFSIAGNRERDWGKTKSFKEGQKKQQLDDLVFDYINTIGKLKPKVFILENVKGLIYGNARAYVHHMKEKLVFLGYRVQLFLLDASHLGVPQKRQRVFFIGLRKDIKKDKLELKFNCIPILFQEVINRNNYRDDLSQSKLTELYADYWFRAKLGSTVGRFNAVGKKLDPLKIAPTCLASSEAHYHPIEQRMLSKNELSMLGSYPLDYKFNGSKFNYLIGMSVPPVMMANIATQIKKQWLD